MQVERFLSKPGHDYGKFGAGNKKTLMDDARKNGIEPREALLKFHKQWYSANIMSLCIVGSESLDELEAYLGTLGFDTIENKQGEPTKWENPYGREQLGRRIEIVPIGDIRSLAIRFPTQMIRDPADSLDEKSSPSRYIYGLHHAEDVISLIFGYIGLLKRTGAAKWIHDECNKLGELKFRFKNKENPLSLAEELASGLPYGLWKDTLSWRYFKTGFNPDRIMEILDMLTPQNMFYMVTSKIFSGQEGNTEEPVYGTEMRISGITEDTMSRFQAAIETVHPALHMPQKNEYIPTKFDLKPREAVKRHFIAAESTMLATINVPSQLLVSSSFNGLGPN
nr:Peptidase M16 domain containing protein [Haemonchus contortus]